MTEDEIDLELAELTIALSKVLKIGQEYEVETSGSSKRKLKAADYNAMITRKNDLIAMKRNINGEGAFNIGVNW